MLIFLISLNKFVSLCQIFAMSIFLLDRKSKAKIATSVFALFLWLLNCSCWAKDPRANFVFGDSLVDAGNNNYITSLSKANFYPNGIDFGKPTGRYTNGRTIADIIGQELGFPGFAPPYLAPTTRGGVVLHGVNYASGGGGILNETGEIFGGRLNLDAQIDNFENTRHFIMKTVGDSAAMEVLNGALFSVTIGSNDFINNYLTPLVSTVEQRLIPPTTFVNMVISKYRLQLLRLQKLGARKVIITNIGPIGCIPYERDGNPQTAAGNGCAILPNQMAQLFNSRLKSLIKELNTNIGSKFVYANVYGIVEDIIQNYKSYGFENADSACCSSIGRHGGLVPCLPPARLCANRSKFVFWDAYHPSEAANLLIAKRLINGKISDIWPMNVKQLVQS